MHLSKATPPPPKDATLLPNHSRSPLPKHGNSRTGRKETQRAIDGETHKQRRALGDRKQRTEKDTQGLKRDLEPRLKPNCHEKMRVAMATQEPPGKHVSRGGSGARGLGPGSLDHMH